MASRTSTFVWLFLCLTGFPICGFAQSVDVPRIDDTPQFSGLSTRWKATLESIGSPGFAVAVVKDGKVLALDAFGFRNANRDSVNVDTMYYIASATKPMVAMTVLILQDEGKLNIDDPVSKYLPDFGLANANPEKPITLRDVLCHAAGINEFKIVWKDAYTGQITDGDYYRMLRDVEASRSVDYSNVHYTLLGRVIGAVTGKSWKDVLDEKLFAPAAMHRSTAYASKLYSDDNVAIPMLELDRKWEVSPVVKTDRTMHAAGGVGLSARDAAQWLLLNLEQGSIDDRVILRKATCQEMLSMQARFPEIEGSIRQEEGFALGWQMGNYRGKYRPMFMHGGGYVGTASYFAFLPDERIGVAVLANAGPSGNAITSLVMIDVFDRLLGIEDVDDLKPRFEQLANRMRATPEMKQPAGTNPAEESQLLTLSPEEYEGEFQSEDWGMATVELGDDQLSIQIGDLPLRLFGTAPDKFEYWIHPGMHSQGRFVVKDQHVSEIELQFDDTVMRFQRVKED